MTTIGAAAPPCAPRGDCRLDLRYGAGPRCLLDVFSADKDAPVLFFIHGGYWARLGQVGRVFHRRNRFSSGPA